MKRGSRPSLATPAWARLIGLLLMLGLAACAGLSGPRTVTVTPQQIERAMARQFPFDRAFGEFVDVQAARPQLRLLPEENRIGTSLDLRLTPRLAGGSWRGQLVVDSALRFEPSDLSVRLVNPRVRTLQIDGLDDTPLAGGVNLQRLGAFVLEELLNGQVIYRFAPEDLSRAGVRYQPGDLRVTPDGVSVTLTPQ